MAIRLITDTSSDYEPEELHSRGIQLVPMTINAGERSYEDGIDLKRPDFYEMLLNDRAVLKTSQPSPHAFETLFEQAKRNGDTVIALLISGSLSGTVQSALTAKMLCGYDKIYIVDTLCASAGIQILVEEAEKRIRAGETAEAIVEHLNDLKGRIRAYFGLDTLKYLYRGGRLSRVEAGIGTLAALHPLLGLTRNGTLEVTAKCIGLKKAIRRLAELLRSVPADPAYGMRFLYSHDDTNCRALMQHFPEYEGAQPLEIGATLACHSGPGVYGAVFVAKQP